MKLTDIEKDIMHCLNMKIADHQKVTLAQIAEECHVAKSTVVKFSKKLGYSGFVEMYYQLSDRQKKKTFSEITLADTLVEHDLNQCIDELVNILYKFKNCKNFVNSYGRDDMLSAYIARKLMMFDLFAPSTYDFAMVKNLYLSKGVALFPDLRKTHPFEGKDIMKLAKQEGYYIVAFSDTELTWAKKYVDYFVKIKVTEYKSADFFEAKIIMLMEMVLSEYSRTYYFDKAKDEGQHYG